MSGSVSFLCALVLTVVGVIVIERGASLADLIRDLSSNFMKEASGEGKEIKDKEPMGKSSYSSTNDQMEFNVDSVGDVWVQQILHLANRQARASFTITCTCRK